jgi:hypothetical protein
MVLKTNNRVASSVGQGYRVQLGKIYLEMLQVYKMYSSFVSARIEAEGSKATLTVRRYDGPFSRPLRWSFDPCER